MLRGFLDSLFMANPQKHGFSLSYVMKEKKNEGLIHQQRSTIGSLAHLAHTRSLVLTILISQEMFPKLRPEATRIDIDW